MRLLIISNVVHYRRDGRLVGHGPTVTEISCLAQIFGDISHIAYSQSGQAPEMALPYSTDQVDLVLVPASGGLGLHDKLNILRLTPLYIRTMLTELPKADVVHVRCPANIGLLAIVLLAFVRSPRLRWVKYAGNWQPARREPWSYTFQRWWLRKGLHRGFVTVNGEWPNQPAHVRQFINPCLTDEEVRAAAEIARVKTLSAPLRLLFVGAVNEAKGVGRALQIVQRLHRNSIPLIFDIIGDGAASGAFVRQAQELGIGSCVHFHGALPRTALNDYYAQAHIMLFPTTSSEGWPKVLSEGMAYGVVPVSGNVSSIPYHLGRFKIGQALDPYDLEAFAEAIERYWSQPALWEQEAQRGPDAARHFTYSAYLRDVRELLGLPEGAGSGADAE